MKPPGWQSTGGGLRATIGAGTGRAVAPHKQLIPTQAVGLRAGLLSLGTPTPLSWKMRAAIPHVPFLRAIPWVRGQVTPARVAAVKAHSPSPAPHSLLKQSREHVSENEQPVWLSRGVLPEAPPRALGPPVRTPRRGSWDQPAPPT